MSTLNQNMAECKSVVQRLLEVNMKAMEIMAAIYSNSDVHIGERAHHISLIEHANNFQLLPPEIVQYILNLEDDRNIQFCEAVLRKMVLNPQTSKSNWEYSKCSTRFQYFTETKATSLHSCTWSATSSSY